MDLPDPKARFQELAGGDGPPAPELPDPAVRFAELATQQDDVERDSKVQEAFARSVGAGIDQRAAVLRLAEETGADPTFLEDNFQAIKTSWDASGRDAREWRRNNALIDQMISKHPLTAELAVKDEKLSEFSKSMRGVAVGGYALDQAVGGLKAHMDPEAPWYSKMSAEIASWGWPGSPPPPTPDALADFGRLMGQVAPKQITELNDARAKAGRAETGLVGRASTVLQSYEDAQKDIEASRAGYQLALDMLAGRGTYESEKRLVAAESAIEPLRDYGATSDFEQLLHDAARTTAPSMAESLRWAGIGSLLAGAGTFALTRDPVTSFEVAVGTGATAGGAAASFVLETGSTLRELRKAKTDQGDLLDPKVVAGTALIAGAAKAAIETLSFGKTAEAFGPLTAAAYQGKLRELLMKAAGSDADFRRLALKAGNAWLEGAGVEGIEEFTQNITDDVAQWAARRVQAGQPQFANPSVSLLEGGGAAVDAFKGSLIVSGVGPLVSAPAQYKAAKLLVNRQASLRGAEVVQHVVEGGKSPTARANPKAMAELVERFSAEVGEPVTHLYVDPGVVGVLYQDPTKVMGPDARARLDEANLTGEKIAIPVEEFYRTWAVTPQAERLAPHLTIRPGHETTIALKQENAEDEAAAQELAKKYLAEETPPASDAEKRLVDAVGVQLRQSGVYNQEKVRYVIALQRAFLRTQAARHGLDVDTLFNDYSLRVERGVEQPDVPAAVPAVEPRKPHPAEKAAAAARKRRDDLAAAGPKPMSWERRDGKGAVVVSPDPSKPGKWRATNFDGDQPTGHIEAPDFKEAVAAAHDFADTTQDTIEDTRKAEKEAAGPSPEGQAAPPVPAGHVRVYTGHHRGMAGESRWFTTDRKYADDGYAKRHGDDGVVSYLDLPRDHPMFFSDYPEQTIEKGFGVSRELDAETARRAKPLPREAAPETPPPPSEHPQLDAAPRAALSGASTKVLTAQRPQGEPAHYAVIEAADLVPSHSPDSFTPNPAYPEGVQEREYHRQAEEQLKVVRGAETLNPGLLLTDTPTAVDGPPMVAPGPKAIVLGGNGRSMMLLRALRDPAQAEAYRSELMRRAATFGVDPEAVGQMKAPVLVRVLEGVDPQDKASLQGAVRRTNEALTQALSARARAVAEARQLTPQAVSDLSDLLAREPDRTLRQGMADSPREIVEILRRAEVITDSNRAAWVQGEELSDEAKERLEGMFLGRVVGSADRLAAATASLLAKVERITSSLVQVEGGNPTASLIPAMQQAMDLIAEAETRRTTIAALVNQRGLFGEDRTGTSSMVVALARLLSEEKQVALGLKFREWAGVTARPDLFVSPQQALEKLLGKERLLQAAVSTLGQGEAQPKGFMQRVRDMFRVVLNPDADLSTYLHEAGHVFLEMMGDLADRPDAPQSVKDEWARIVAYLGTERTATWADGTPTFPTEAHEKWARSFEAWLLEGKAPTEELQGAFNRFRRWLLGIYRSAASLHVELNDDIRGVFERMLATDEELNRGVTEIGGIEPLFLSAESAGMTPEQYRDYLDTRQKALSTAQRRAELKILKERLWHLESWWKDEAAQIEEQVSAEYEALPERRTWNFLHGQAKSEDGKSLGGKVYLDQEQARRFLTKEQAKRFPLRKDGGADIDEVAQSQGWDAGYKMLQALAALPDKKTWVRETVQERMQAKHPGMLEERDQLRALVLEGLNGPYTVKFLMQEWAALRSRGGQKGKDVQTELKRLRRAAVILSERMTIGELTPGRVLQRERAAAEKTAKAAARGNFAQASIARQQQILNMLLHQQLLHLREEMAGIRRGLLRRKDNDYRAKLAKASPDLENPVFLQMHDALLAAMGITDPAALQSPEAAALALEALVEVDRLAAEDDNPLSEGLAEAVRRVLLSPKDWADQTPETARAVNELVHHVKALADHRTAVRLGEQEMELDEIAFRLAQETRDLPDHGLLLPDSANDTPSRRRKRAFVGAHGEMLDPKTILFQLGSMGEGIWSGYEASRHKKHELTREILEPLIELWTQELPSVLKDRFKAVEGVEDELPFPEDVAQIIDGLAPRDRLWLIMVALNMGSTSNRDRLLTPMKWTEKQVLDVLNKHLTHDEWKFIQSVWDSFDEKLWPELEAKEKRKRGLAPPKIQATAIETAYGTFRGGYFPARYHYEAGRGAARRAQAAEGIARFKGNEYQFAATPSSHRKPRAERYSDVIDLRWQVVPSHIAQVIHDVAFDEFVRDTARILDDRRVRGVLLRRLGQRLAQAPEDWLVDVANAQAYHAAGVQGHIAQFAQAMASRSVVGALGWSFTVALADLSNPFVMMAREFDGGLGVYYGLKGYLAALPATPWGAEMRQMAFSKSRELQDRAAAMSDKRLQEYLRAIAERHSMPRRVLTAVGHTVWFFLEQTDKLASTQMWLARYWHEMATHGDEQIAITRADHTVQDTLPSHSMVERPQLLRRPGFIGAVTSYFGWFVKLYDQIFGQIGHQAAKKSRRAVRTGLLEALKVVPLEAAKWAGKSAAMLFFSNVMGELLAGRGPEEDQEPEDWVLQQWLASPLTMIPVVGGMAEQKAKEVIAGLQENGYDGQTLKEIIQGKAQRYSGRFAPPVLSFFPDQFARLGKIVDDDASSEERVWAAVELGLAGAKLGVTQPRRTFRGFYEMLDSDNPSLRSLVYGPKNPKHPRDNIVSLFER